MEVTVIEEKQVPVTFLRAQCGVRYWEDGTVNGEEDADGTLIPFRRGEIWDIKINLETGAISDWPKGTVAEVHYKVCEDGVYSLLKDDGSIAVEIDGYVPSMLAPDGDGYGDYVILKIDENGQIQNWEANLSPFEKGE